MNIQVSARTFTSAAALLADHAAVRRRLFNPGRRVDASLSEQNSSDPLVTVRRRLPREKLHFHDAHVMAFRRWMMIAASGPCTLHLLNRCMEVDVSFELVTGPSRKKEITRIRQMLMWELKTFVQPEISYPAIGRLFGGRDHTTALHGVRAHQARVTSGEA